MKKDLLHLLQHNQQLINRARPKRRKSKEKKRYTVNPTITHEKIVIPPLFL